MTLQPLSPSLPTVTLPCLTSLPGRNYLPVHGWYKRCLVNNKDQKKLKCITVVLSKSDSFQNRVRERDKAEQKSVGQEDELISVGAEGDDGMDELAADEGNDGEIR